MRIGYSRQYLLRSVLLLMGSAAIIAGSPARAVTWLGGVDPFVRHVMKPSEPSDYATLFITGAPWGNAAKTVRVFKTSTQFLVHGPDDQVRQMISGLRARGIALAVEALMIPKREACGAGVEGYAAPQEIARAAERVKSLGGELDYAAMDEPLWFGHHFSGPNACRSAIADVAQQVAESVKALRAVFPNVRVGDIEPVAARGSPSDWTAEIMSFAAAYKAATGTPLDFFHADISWSNDWRAALGELVPSLRTTDIRFGIIYNGDPQDDTDIAWTRHAEERFETIEADDALRPDDAILQTWMLHPAHMLPEDQPGTMTNLVLRYARARPHLVLSRDGGALSGRLSAEDGRPLADLPVSLSAVDALAATHPAPRAISGVVPAGAAFAVSAIRVNAECDCNGSGELAYGAPVYRDAGGTRPMEGLAAADAAEHRHIEDGKSFAATSHPVPVVPNSGYTLQFPLDASAAMAHAGYAAVIFLDDRSKEIRRVTVNLGPSEQPIGTVTTDKAGGFTLPISHSAPGLLYRAHFAGNDAVRGITAESR